MLWGQERVVRVWQRVWLITWRLVGSQINCPGVLAGRRSMTWTAEGWGAKGWILGSYIIFHSAHWFPGVGTIGNYGKLHCSCCCCTLADLGSPRELGFYLLHPCQCLPKGCCLSWAAHGWLWYIQEVNQENCCFNMRSLMGRASKDHRESRGAGLRPLVLQVIGIYCLKSF